uniref:Uncharacterized protein n=1 Tax=Anguilla anguilla TaxID=7936 RepID=A0A0E9QQ71_ANGAN
MTIFDVHIKLVQKENWWIYETCLQNSLILICTQ